MSPRSLALAALLVGIAGLIPDHLAHGQSAALEQAQHALGDEALERGDVAVVKGARFVEAQHAVAFAEHAVDDGAMVVNRSLRRSPGT